MAIAGRGPLDIREAVVDGQHILALSGEMDIASVDEVEFRIARLCGARAREIVVDLSNIRFIDVSGLRAILTAQDLCRDRGVGFTVASPSPTVRHVVEISGFDALAV